MTDHEPDISVIDNGALERFEISLDGALAGFAEYQLDDDRIVFTHTEIDPVFDGHGLGGRLVETALNTARTRGLRVVPKCPFVADYIDKHPSYADLVDA
jgi:predicted GNAT family acetyltransferase